MVSIDLPAPVSAEHTATDVTEGHLMWKSRDTHETFLDMNHWVNINMLFKESKLNAMCSRP